MDLKSKIQEINEFIKETNVLTHFGGLCYLKQTGDKLYGISTEPDCAGNLFGNNHSELSGFTSILQSSSRKLNDQVIQIVCRLQVHDFVPHKLIGENQKYYYVGSSLFARLNSRFWKRYNLEMGTINNKYLDIEYCVINMDIPFLVGCEDLDKNIEIC